MVVAAAAIVAAATIVTALLTIAIGCNWRIEDQEGNRGSDWGS